MGGVWTAALSILAVRPLLHEVSGQNGQESGQDNDIHPVFREFFVQSGLKGLLGHLLFGNGDAGHAMVGRPGQGVGVFVAGAHQHDLPVGDIAPLLGIQQSLQIGAAAGDEYGDACFFQHNVTRSSPETISPMA